ncbi:class I SAM-dependent methyltransferase [Candidatus Microgenomates bacterium]|nr:class I SAM-dependent methyltransferase [Candidatus Microgenomates bacterium]
MRKGDYQTTQKAQDYNYNRFGGGLTTVDLDERSILSSWINKYAINKNTLLDLGSGTGRIIKSLIKFNPKVIIALDASDYMLKELKSNFSNEKNSKVIKTILSTSDKTKQKNNSIDIVTTFHLFKHLPQIDSTLKEANRILVPGGILVFDVLNKYSIVSTNVETCYVYTKKQIIKKLQNNGFTVLETKYIHFLGETIYKLLYPWGNDIWHIFDSLFSSLGIPFGTKIMVIAKKK